MSDVCFTCPLPDCNENDPRCAYRQSGEYQHRVMLWKQQRDRKREREQRMAEQRAGAEARKARLTELARVRRCRIMWDHGAGTQEIAARLGVPESVVHNEILQKARAL